MRKLAYSLTSRTPPAVVYTMFLVLLVLAIAPASRVILFGLSLDDLLQLRCFGVG
ncbi:hypothetical protein JJB99_28070 [Bradyrhizobium diazoefficiens]|uniref:hypothetical protein n=1 Tax=Bradyrhizobium diazoefficiens TaxID=1355477 RepID=UPI00190C91DB|nr:hypothetical protein [Bradyrhizobium diazoefficiens]QQO13237.1 hypothetical protein JJB99_28070 [Bradyrhizobium diazoefficiens]